jgi:hypothetical protein
MNRFRRPALNDDLHVRLLRRVARRARQGLAGAAPATDDAERAELQRASEVADERLSIAEARRRPTPSAPPALAPSPGGSPGPDAERSSGRPEPSIGELRALSAHAVQRLALYRRRMYLGRGEPRRLAELERIAAGARDRLSRARR